MAEAPAPARKDKRRAASAYDALRSLNKARRAARRSARRKSRSVDAEGDARPHVGAPRCRRSAGAARAPRLATRDRAAADDGRASVRRTRCSTARSCTTTSVPAGLVLDVGRARRLARARRRSATTELALARDARVRDAPTSALARRPASFVYRHRFAEPFDDADRAPRARSARGARRRRATCIALSAPRSSRPRARPRGALSHGGGRACAFAERRSNFVAAVTHELKTPLTAIRMYGEMLRDGIVPLGSEARTSTTGTSPRSPSGSAASSTTCSSSRASRRARATWPRRPAPSAPVVARGRRRSSARTSKARGSRCEVERRPRRSRRRASSATR